MFRMMVTPWREASPYLGVGTYYLGTDTDAEAPQDALVNVTLEAPLILNARQVRMLVQKYGTDSPDHMTALSGAWTLRREILQMGHDGIITVGSSPNEGRLTLVTLGRPTDKPGNAPPGGDGRRSGAEIARLVFAEIAALR
ncbi:MAG TPA: hypothetical protein VGP48_09285 [Stellaceae bacterium]|jgi:hypothetical protein|nr:hypothetical protein [Stellaceae bacterium]